MISREVLHSLSEDELAMVLHVLNAFHPPGFNLTVDKWLLASYKKDALMAILAHYRQRVLPEGLLIYDTAIAKLNGTYNIVTKNDTESTKPTELGPVTPPPEPSLEIRQEGTGPVN